MVGRLVLESCPLEGRLSGVGRLRFRGDAGPFIDVVGPGSDAALVVPEAGFDVVWGLRAA